MTTRTQITPTDCSPAQKIWTSWTQQNPAILLEHPTCYVARFFGDKNIYLDPSTNEPWNHLSTNSHSWEQWWGIDETTGEIDVILFDDDIATGTRVTISPATPLEALEYYKRKNLDTRVMEDIWKEFKASFGSKQTLRASNLLSIVGR